LSEETGRTGEIDVSVIVVTWNSERWVAACLDALGPACLGLEWELIVVDNDSSDLSADVAEVHASGRGRVIRAAENLGFAGGVNLAAETASGRCLLLLNPDCVLDPGAVSRLVDACEADPSRAGAVPILRGVDGSSQAKFQFRRLPTPGAFVAELLFLDRLAPWNPWTARYRCRDRDFSRPGDVEQPAFAAIVLRTRIVRREGPIDERFQPAWFDDVDYCRRLRGNGYRLVVVPEATGMHVGGASLDTMRRGVFAVYWYRNMDQYAKKWFDGRGVALLRWGILAGMVLRIVATAAGLGRFESRREALRGWVEVLKAAWSRWETTFRSS
jgi:hypothetical protein